MASLEHLIDTGLLLQFGQGTIVPIVGTISSLATSLQSLADEVEALEPGSMDGTFGKRLGAAEQNIVALALAMAIETGAEVDGTADNVIVEAFGSTSGYILSSGAYDSTNHWVYA